MIEESKNYEKLYKSGIYNNSINIDVMGASGTSQQNKNIVGGLDFL